MSNNNNNSNIDKDIEEQMTPEHFKAAVKDMKFSSDRVVKAAFLVLCANEGYSEAAKKYDVNQPQVSRAVKSIKAKWEEVHDKAGCICEPVMLPREEMAVVRLLEKKYVSPLLKSRQEGWERYGLDEEFNIDE